MLKLLTAMEMSQNYNACIASDCLRHAVSKNMCDKHYRRFLKHGDMNFVHTFNSIKCSVSECERKAVSRGMCDKHYRRNKKYGDPYHVSSRQKYCLVDGCNNKHAAKGMCSWHYEKTRQRVDAKSADFIKNSHDGKCAICKTTEPGGPNNAWCLDHDHKTGKARGMLCSSCNLALGHFKDSPDIMNEAIKYLIRTAE